MDTSLVRLRKIADEIRHLPDAFGDYVPGVMETGGALVAEAIELGAFSSEEYAAFRAKVKESKIESEQTSPKFWRSSVFNVAANHFASGLFARRDGEQLACAPIADALDEEIRRMTPLPTAKPEQGEWNGGTVDRQELPQSVMIANYHDNSVNIQGNVQGSNVAAGGSNIAGSSASYNNSEELIDALKALIPLIPTGIKCQEDEVKGAIEVLVRAADDPAVPAKEIEQAATVVADSSPTLRKRLGDILGRIGIGLTASAIFQGIKMALGIS